MVLWAEVVYLYRFFNFGAILGGWSMPRPGIFTSKKETRYTLYCSPNGPQARRGVQLHFL